MNAKAWADKPFEELTHRFAWQGRARVSSYHIMRCPMCGDINGLHVDEAHTEASESVAVSGWCEFCPDRFKVAFRTHKGQVIVETTTA